MKYYWEHYNDNNEFIREEVTREKAILELENGYNNAEQCVELPCYYRLMFGGVEVVQE